MNNTVKTTMDDIRLQKAADLHMGYAMEKTLARQLGINEESTTQKSLMYTDLSSPKLMQRVSEAGLANEADVIQGFIANIPWEEYHLPFTLTHDAKKTDQQGALVEHVKDYTTRVAQTHDYRFGAIFRNATDTSVTLADGKSLISGLHPLKSGGTMANTFPDTQFALSYTSLNVAQSILTTRMKNHTGELIPRMGQRRLTLLVPNEPAIVETAFQLVIGNSQGLRPGTANNDANFYQKYEGVKYDLIVSDLLTLAVAQSMGETTTDYGASLSRYETQWFLLDTNMVKAAFKKIMFQDSGVIFKQTENRNLTTVYDVFSFFGHGCTSAAPFAIFGSRGDGAATNY